MKIGSYFVDTLYLLNVSASKRRIAMRNKMKTIYAILGTVSKEKKFVWTPL